MTDHCSTLIKQGMPLSARRRRGSSSTLAISICRRSEGTKIFSVLIGLCLSADGDGIRERFGIAVSIARFQNCYGPEGTWERSR